jgi:hypothetical protein
MMFMVNRVIKRIVLLGGVMCMCNRLQAQFLMDMPDSTELVKVSGYIQPQFQYAQGKGVASYSGGDFPEHSNNRFMLRRGRIRFDYVHRKKKKTPSFQFALQLDGTERGVFIRDLWGKVLDSRWQVFSITTGMFARPFGYEVNLSSSDRESPERGRMSQILMKTERDLGLMFGFHPVKPEHPLHHLSINAGFFNGQGLTSLNDFDSYKDFIGRASVTPFEFGDFSVSGGLSYFNGGFLQNTRYINKVSQSNGSNVFYVDSSSGNMGGKAPRKYKGADVQFKWKSGESTSEIRAEYWQGTQTSLAGESETPGDLPDEPYYIRDFNGAFLYLLHRFTEHHQLAVKYDWYDPNTKIKGTGINADTRFNPADIKYSTLGFGYINHIEENLKLTLWYDIVRNERSALRGYENDLNDDVFTCRLQFRF